MNTIFLGLLVFGYFGGVGGGVGANFKGEKWWLLSFVYVSKKVFQGFMAWCDCGKWVELKDFFQNSEINKFLLVYYSFLYCLVKVLNFSAIYVKTKQMQTHVRFHPMTILSCG